jgi:hypothetical protein
MKVTIQTLVDITETGVRKGPDKLAVGQQTNWDTLIQVIGLRANPEPQQGNMANVDVSDYKFGKTYTGKHNVWTYEFWLPDGSVSIDDLENESFASTMHVFLTKNVENCNILFNETAK